MCDESENEYKYDNGRSCKMILPSLILDYENERERSGKVRNVLQYGGEYSKVPCTALAV